MRLAEAAISCLVKPAARNRIHNREQMLKAAAFQARHPGAPLREIAKAAGVDHTLIRQWKSQFAYKSELRRATEAVWQSVDALLVPTFPRPRRVAEAEADPIGPNSELGAYTNFVNLLDYVHWR